MLDKAFFSAVVAVRKPRPTPPVDVWFHFYHDGRTPAHETYYQTYLHHWVATQASGQDSWCQ